MPQASLPRTSLPDILRLTVHVLLLVACFLVVTGFDACSDDPILDPAGGTQTCHPSYGCSAALATDPARDTRNPERF